MRPALPRDLKPRVWRRIVYTRPTGPDDQAFKYGDGWCLSSPARPAEYHVYDTWNEAMAAAHAVVRELGKS